MGSQFEDALRSDLPGLSIRVPGTESEVRIYGFAKLSGYNDLNGRNQNNAPSPSTIPLANSAAAQQGGDFGMTARFSRFGVDTRTLTSLGTLETRIEGDFGGGPAASNNLIFRLRQAWAELGTPSFRVLVGQANSLWNEGMFETLNDSTNLNQSFVRQAQIRLTGRLATGLIGQLSLEAPDTQYISAAGVFTPESSLNGGPSPAFNALPDLLTRLTYSQNGLELDARGLLRQLSIRTAGTAAAPPVVSQSTVGWALLRVRVFRCGGCPRHSVPINSSAWPIMDKASDVILPAIPRVRTWYPVSVYPAHSASARTRCRPMASQWPTAASGRPNCGATSPIPTRGRTIPPTHLASRRDRRRPRALNSDMQQAIVNLIWSPFATIQNGTVSTGWLDVGLEYIYTSRDVFGGAQAAGPAGAGYGIANRIMAAATVRF